MPYGTVNADSLVSSDGGVISPNINSLRNRIINGAMVISQYNGTSTVTPSGGQYTMDRWKFSVSQSSKLTTSQSSVAPIGFTNSLLATSSSAYSVAAGDYFVISQKVEGFNCSDLGWGTANAKTVTLSFWVNCSLTGTFAVTILNGANNRSYPATYTVNSANTWEQKTITIAGDTSGTWLTTNGIGLDIYWNLGVGSTYSGTANTWSASQYYSATGATSVVGTNGATFYITGVQLEKGSVATSFDYRPYGTELALCQRYYEEIGRASSGGLLMAGCSTVIGQQINTTFVYKVTKRAAPTVTRVGSWNLINVAGQPNIYGADVDNVLFYASSSATGSAYAQNSNANNYITISAEL